MPRFMLLMRATPESEAGQMPPESALAAMGAFNEEMVAAGVMQAGEGLHPSKVDAARVHYAKENEKPPVVQDGPFAETKELIGGFWIIKTDSFEDALDWARRIPRSGEEFSVELRRVFEMEDFGEEFTPELREREERTREQAEEN